MAELNEVCGHQPDLCRGAMVQISCVYPSMLWHEAVVPTLVQS